VTDCGVGAWRGRRKKFIFVSRMLIIDIMVIEEWTVYIILYSIAMRERET